MFILVTNDDGIHAPGIIALAEALEELGDITVVAPDRERSAIGHALTLHHPLRATEIRKGFFSVDGTPTDCVNLGINSLLARKPDLVVSGINNGSNLADDITYSGTVSGAMEATMMGIPSFAISLATDGTPGNFRNAAAFAVKLAKMLYKKGLPADTFLNVNVPDIQEDCDLPFIFTRQGTRRYDGTIVEKIDPRGRKYYWIGSNVPTFMDQEGTDFYAVKRNHISITPLHFDLTNYTSLALLGEWTME